nr:MAG TPA: hypothetical protein [Caudoviricetes sp.]
MRPARKSSGGNLVISFEVNTVNVFSFSCKNVNKRPITRESVPASVWALEAYGCYYR